MFHANDARPSNRPARSRPSRRVQRSYARTLGFTDGQIDWRLATGRWIARSCEALVIAGAPRTFEQELLIATLSVPDAAGSHESAAQVEEMFGVPRDRIVVSIPLGGNHRLPVGKVHESKDLKPRDITMVRGIRVTTRERTLCDLGRVLSAKQLGRTIDHELLTGWVTLPGLYGVFYRYARRGRPGIAKVRSVLEQRGPGFVVPESELEARTLELFAAWGIRRPDQQVELEFWESLAGRVDFAWLEERVIVEVDGRRWHGDETFESDRERDNAAILAGWSPFRFTWDMVTQRQDYVVRTVLEALRQGRVGALRPTFGNVSA